MNQNERRQLLAAPYRLRGRTTSGIDCLGVVLHVLQLRGSAALDPWRNLLHEWKSGQVATASAFPCDWHRCDGPLIEGDVGIFQGDHSWAAIVYQGEVWSAHPDAGVWCKQLCNFQQTPNEIWRQLLPC